MSSAPQNASGKRPIDGSDQSHIDEKALGETRGLCYKVLAFAGAAAEDSEAAEARQDALAIVEPGLLKAIKAGNDQEPMSSEILKAWWDAVVAVSYETTGITPEGEFLLQKLHGEMLDIYGDQALGSWKRTFEEALHSAHGRWRIEDKLRKASIPSEINSTSAGTHDRSSLSTERESDSEGPKLSTRFGSPDSHRFRIPIPRHPLGLTSYNMMWSDGLLAMVPDFEDPSVKPPTDNTSKESATE